jgi:two-component system OmpR family response regulator/two-component system response regulator QseB
VVEKDVDLRRLNLEILTCSGYDVDAAADGAAALVALQSNDYDLVVTEKSLPKVSGVELVKQLYAAQVDLPVIMTTSRLATWAFTKYPWLQPATLLLKPYTFEELLKTVKEVLYATASIRNEIAPPPNWQSPPVTSRWGLNQAEVTV